MKDYEIRMLKAHGWEVECESPFEIRNEECESFARGLAASIVLWAIGNGNFDHDYEPHKCERCHGAGITKRGKCEMCKGSGNDTFFMGELS